MLGSFIAGMFGAAAVGAAADGVNGAAKGVGKFVKQGKRVFDNMRENGVNQCAFGDHVWPTRTGIGDGVDHMECRECWATWDEDHASPDEINF